VLEVLNKLGFEVFNADKSIHEMMKRGGAAFDKVAALFPSSVVDQGIDRKILGELVIADVMKLRALEEIIHPLVRQAQVDFVVSVRQGSGKSMVFEIPLLFENKREKNYDLIISTVAPTHLQKKRALERPNMTEEKFDAIIKKQVSNNVRIKGSQYVIYTAKSKEDTIRQIKAIIKGENVKRNSSRHGDNRPIRKKR
jgi:dephospho-CoA kinase